MIDEMEKPNHSTVLVEAPRPVCAPNVREAVFEDYSRIAAVQAQNGLVVPSRDGWLALWKDNPVYRARGGDWPIGWVLEAESGEIVGTISNLPLAYSLRGRTLVTAAPCSWAIDVAYRGHSMLLLNRVMSQKCADLLVSTTVSLRAERGCRALGWSRVPVGSWDRSEFWITDHRGFAQHAVLQNAGAFGTILSVPVSAGLLGWEALRPMRTRITGGTPEISVLSAFDSRFDEFWAELKQQNPDLLLAVRSRAALEWHFRRSLTMGRIWVLTATRNSRLVAYAIFDRLDNTAFGLNRVRFVDFQCLRGAEDTLRESLLLMLQLCRQEGMHCLELTGGWLGRPGQPRIAAPYDRRLKSWTFYYKAASPEIRNALKDPKVWAPTSFDGDGSL